MPKKKDKVLIIKQASYEGNDTFVKVFPNPLFMIVNAATGEIIDSGYRSYKEAKETYGLVKTVDIIN